MPAARPSVSRQYETHRMPDPLLPFIFHRRFSFTGRHGLVNWHENVELLFCTEGRGEVRCGQEVQPFLPGDLFVVNADLPHCVGSNGTVAYRCLIVDNGFFLQNGLPVGEMYFRSHIRQPEAAELFEAVTAAYARQEAGAPLAAAEIRSAVLRLLLYLCTRHRSARPGEAAFSGSGPVKKAVDYLRRHALEPVTLDQISAHAGVSKFYLARQFRTYTGKTVVQTLQLIRCTEAQRLLEDGASVTEAASACGFENLSYFTRTFKKLFGVLPSQVGRRSGSGT